MAAWKLVPAGVTLRGQINNRWPGRDKASDGSIGDPDHASRVSDHNPDADGWVHAIDVDEDLGERGASERLANELLEYARLRKPGSERLKNIVYEDRVASGTYPNKFWVWRYDSSLDHHAHIHISFTDAAERDGSLFPLDIFKEDGDVALSDEDIEKIWAKPMKTTWDGNIKSAKDVLLQAHFYSMFGGLIGNVPATAAGQQGNETSAKRIFNESVKDAPGVPGAPSGGLSDADKDDIAQRTANVLYNRLKA